MIALAAISYFWHLGRADIITDESSYATRAIKMVDFDFGVEQPTPWQWISTEPPWWMRLSFHDHPPLVFLLQHWSIGLFGENPFAIRLPSVIAGLAAVTFVYLIGRKLYSQKVGLASAALFAFTANHVFISRIGLQESLLIALMLASTYFFLKGLEQKKYLYFSAVFLGFAFLAKYLALILIPIFITFLVTERVRHKYGYGYAVARLGLKEITLAVLLFIVVASPVLIYNIQLYRNFGHFDFQFSLLLHQNVKEWPARPGQESLGSYSQRLKDYIPRIIGSNSPYFLIIAAAGLILVISQLISKRLRQRQEPPAASYLPLDNNHSPPVISHWLLAICLLWLLPFLVFVGPAHRFLTILLPWLAISAGLFVVWLGDKIKAPQKVLTMLFVILLAVEGTYSYNSVIAVKAAGQSPWAYADVRRQSRTWGFNELDEYLSQELGSKAPEIGITFEFPFAKKLLTEAAEKAQNEKLETIPAGIVYNDNINLSAQLWVFLRRIVYDGWPTLSAESFRNNGGQEFFIKSGIKKIYFINATENTLQDRTRPPTPDGDIMESQLRAMGAKPKEIKNPQGQVAFRVYEFGFR